MIPGNDDAIRAVKLIAGKMADAVLEGKQGEQSEKPPKLRLPRPERLTTTGNFISGGNPMEVTAALVKELRERTGAGMLDCKKMLIEANGDMDKAIDLAPRRRALAAAAKKAGRIAAEGRG